VKAIRRFWRWFRSSPFDRQKELRLSSRFEINHPELYEARMLRAQQRHAIDKAWTERRKKAPVIQFHKRRLYADAFSRVPEDV
jgi:hypothetical protein